MSLSVVVEFSEEVRSEFTMHLGCGTAVDVERDTELLERVLDDLMIAVADILRCNPFFFGTNGDGHSVLVATADEDHVLLLQAKIAHIDVGRNIYPGEVSDVHTAVGIGQCGGDSGAFEFLFFHLDCLYLFIYRCKITKRF